MRMETGATPVLYRRPRLRRGLRRHVLPAFSRAAGSFHQCRDRPSPRQFRETVFDWFIACIKLGRGSRGSGRSALPGGEPPVGESPFGVRSPWPGEILLGRLLQTGASADRCEMTIIVSMPGMAFAVQACRGAARPGVNLPPGNPGRAMAGVQGGGDGARLIVSPL
jgi:hypothetical protein